MELKPISEESRQKLQSLYNSSSFWNRVVKGSKQRVELLREIEQSGENAVIPQLAEFLFDASDDVREAAREAIYGLMQTVVVAQFPELDQRMRTVGSYQENDWWYLKPDAVERLTTDRHGTAIWGIASFHPNGRVREAAIRMLSISGDGSELPFLLLRLNDWVAPVRTAAHRAVARRLMPEYAPHFLRNLLLVLRLETCGREDHSGTVHAVRALLGRSECRQPLLSVFTSGDVAMRRACLRLVAEWDGPERLELLKLGLADGDPIIRLWAARHMLADVPLSELESRAAELLRDRSMPVRREALQTLATRLPDIALPVLRRALLDKSASVRDTARFYLEQGGQFDVAAFYRDMFKKGAKDQLAIAIRGLGETGGQDDAQVVRPFLTDSNPSLRKATVFAISHLAFEQFVGELVEALGDNSPGVSKEACLGLMANLGAINRAELFSKLGESNPYFVRKNALRLLLHLGKWERLAPLLDLCRTGDEQLSQLAQAGTGAWFRRYNASFAEPKSQQIKEAKQALDRSAPFLSTWLTQEIAAILKQWQDS